MIAHVILFRPRPDISAADRMAVLDALRAAASAIPSLRSVKIGRRVRHGLPGYEQAMREDFEYAAILEFDDLEGLKAYLTHPAHASAGRHFTQSSSAALAYDYELADLV
ncbi:MAG TPA: Dabb family protein [Vicinamibacterales bacterium]|nr:Dabb family protein [Vicinamibacterales bacterium]